MRSLKRLFDFYIDSSLHVAFAVAALTLITQLYIAAYNLYLILFVFLSTVVMYNFIKYGSGGKYYFILKSNYLRQIQLLSLFCLLILGFILFKLSLPILLLVGSFGLLSLLYVIPFTFKKYNLRAVYGLKVFVVVFCWAGVSVFLPVVAAGISIDFKVWIWFTQRSIFVLVIMLPFEIRDLRFDNKNLGTIPQLLGVKKTKWLGSFLMLVFWMLSFLKTTVTPDELLENTLIVFAVVGMLWLSKKNQSSYFSSFFVESLPIIWLAIVLIINYNQLMSKTFGE